jgi:hypothetical protein
VTVQDAYGNTVPTYTNTVHFTATNGAQANYTFQPADQGQHTFTIAVYRAQTLGVTGTDPATSITGNTSFTVAAAAADHFAVSAPSGATAGAPFGVTLTVQDAYGNTVPGYTGTVHFTSADPHGASLPADYTFQPGDQGVATFSGVTLYTAGTWDVTATDTSTGISGAALVPVQAAPAVAFQVVAPANAAAGMPFDLTVMAVDAYGNIDTQYTGTVTFSTSDGDPGVVLPPAYTFQASDQGQATFAGGFTLITPGSQTLMVTDPLSGISGSITVTVQ